MSRSWRSTTKKIPRIDKNPEPPGNLTAESPPNDTERILLVDDEESIAHLLKRMLERLGYRVTARTSSVEALQAFCSQPEEFDIVVTDLSMPNISGTDLAAELLDIRPDIPIILCTGFSETLSKEKALAAGIREYIMKPVIASQIGGTIRRVLDKPEKNNQYGG